MPTITQTAHAISRPGNDMRYAGCDLLLTAGAAVGLGRVDPGDPADEPLAVAVGLTPLGPPDGSVQIELGALVASAMGSGHVLIVAGRAASDPMPGCGGAGEFDYFAGATRSANTTTLSS